MVDKRSTRHVLFNTRTTIMKWTEAVGSFTLAVIFALIVTFILPADEHELPTMSEAMLSFISLGLFGLGIYLTIMILVKEYGESI